MSIRYAVVPWIAPASPAFVVGVGFFRDLNSNQGWNFYLAFMAALALALTIELGGAFAAMGFTTFWSQRSWLRMLVAFVALLGYAYFGISLTWHDGYLWPVFVFVTLLYLVIASLDTHKNAVVQAEKTLELELEIEKQRASQERARARQAKFSGFSPEKSLKINERVKLYLDKQEDPSAAKIEEIVNGARVSMGTASEHKRRYLAQTEN